MPQDTSIRAAVTAAAVAAQGGRGFEVGGGAEAHRRLLVMVQQGLGLKWAELQVRSKATRAPLVIFF